jgi:hypothetical protein
MPFLAVPAAGMRESEPLQIRLALDLGSINRLVRLSPHYSALLKPVWDKFELPIQLLNLQASAALRRASLLHHNSGQWLCLIV